MNGRSPIGQTILITGANTGIGRATSEELGRRGARLYLACRSEAKTQPVIDAIRRENEGAHVVFLPLDLGDLDSVRRCAEQFLASGEPLHVLVNNAGLAGQRGATKQGFELAFGTNYLGHFLLTQLLLPRLRASAPARVVHVASDSHYECKNLDWESLARPTRTFMATKEYEISKLCNVLFGAECARRWKGHGVRSYSVDPGTVASDIWRKIPWPIRTVMKRKMISTQEGAHSSLHCATSADVADHDGRYYALSGHDRAPSELAQDPTLARLLWEKSEEWVRAWCDGQPGE
ncbi:SDR family NAD(P)-dependent oxidoreductase [Pendulispora albinea]|uniref:SDR family NAD(P)-dependent oxidoreductase n=1 Tax=Pendulispora albinea TaxID=2741071 RepID=A0ABZ2M423_9BACT